MKLFLCGRLRSRPREDPRRPMGIVFNAGALQDLVPGAEGRCRFWHRRRRIARITEAHPGVPVEQVVIQAGGATPNNRRWPTSLPTR